MDTNRYNDPVVWSGSRGMFSPLFMDILGCSTSTHILVDSLHVDLDLNTYYSIGKSRQKTLNTNLYLQILFLKPSVLWLWRMNQAILNTIWKVSFNIKIPIIGLFFFLISFGFTIWSWDFNEWVLKMIQVASRNILWVLRI